MYSGNAQLHKKLLLEVFNVKVVEIQYQILVFGFAQPYADFFFFFNVMQW